MADENHAVGLRGEGPENLKDGRGCSKVEGRFA